MDVRASSTERAPAFKRQAVADSPGVKTRPRSILKSPDKAAAAAPLVHDMGTPPRAGGDTGGAAILRQPAMDCKTAELRAFVLQKFADVAKDLNDVEMRFMEPLNSVTTRINAAESAYRDIRTKVDALEPLQAHCKDLDVFMKIKNFITADDLERKAQESQAALDALKNKLDTTPRSSTSTSRATSTPLRRSAAASRASSRP